MARVEGQALNKFTQDLRGMDKSDLTYMRMHGFQVLGSQNIKPKFSLHHTADCFSLMKITATFALK